MLEKEELLLMAQLPQNGQENWGDALNEYLLVSHEMDGKLRSSTVGSTNLATPTSGTNGQVLVKDSSSPSGVAWTTTSAADPTIDERVAHLESFSPVLVLAEGEAVPANTPAGTIILRAS